jgi:hypothetical protein
MNADAESPAGTPAGIPAPRETTWQLAAIRRELWRRDAWLEEYFDWIVTTRPGTYASAKLAELYELELQRSCG